MAEYSRRRHTLASRLVRRAVLALYRWKGWRLVETSTVPRKCVILGVPHTTNWDFVFFLGATHQLDIKPAYMGKRSLFKWPMRRFMLDMGGVPVDRSLGGNYVQAMIDEFSRRKEFMLTGSWMSYSAPFPGKEWKMAAHYFKNGDLKFDDSLVFRKMPLSQIDEAFDMYKTPGTVKGKILIDSRA